AYPASAGDRIRTSRRDVPTYGVSMEQLSPQLARGFPVPAVATRALGCYGSVPPGRTHHGHMRTLTTALILLIAMITDSYADADRAQDGFQRLVTHDKAAATSTAIVVDISSQRLFVFQESKLVLSYPISSSKFGIGNAAGSNKTPLG